MPKPCIVLIGAPDLLASLRARAGAVESEVIEFSHVDAQAALQAITNRRPQIVALERLFAMTPRGAAFINRIKADPSLRDSEIRVLAHDSDYMRVVPRPKAPAAEPALDHTGTRRAPRFRIADRVEAMIDGSPALLVDLSTVGAQIVSLSPLKPNQEVVMALPDDAGPIRFDAKVAWTSFMTAPEGSPSRYRAGIDFVNADASAVDAFIQRHKA